MPKLTPPLRLRLDPRVIDMLDELLRTGLFGRPREDVAENLLKEKLRDVVRQAPLRTRKGP